MIVLAIDTCDSRGSVALLREGAVAQVAVHDSTEDYSSWLLPAVEKVLDAGGLGMRDVDAYAVAAGPGSFTGLRVGLTTVKAWSEVYGKRVTAVSRLEVLATQSTDGKPFVAAFADARRGQVFGAVYGRNEACLSRVGEEMVIAPGKFVETATELAMGGALAWVSPDAAQMLAEAAWKDREKRGESIQSVSSILAPMIGKIGLGQLAAGQCNVDALTLDANYVRRSDAEIFWKGGAAHGR